MSGRRKPVTPADVEHQLQHARRVVGAAYAARHADTVTLGMVRALERENAELRARIQAKRDDECTRTGRYVFGNVVSGVLLSAALALVVFWSAGAAR